MKNFLIFWGLGIIMIGLFEVYRRTTGEILSVQIIIGYTTTMAISTLFAKQTNYEVLSIKTTLLEDRHIKENKTVYKELGRLESKIEKNEKDIKDLQKRKDECTN